MKSRLYLINAWKRFSCGRLVGQEVITRATKARKFLLEVRVPKNFKGTQETKDKKLWWREGCVHRNIDEYKGLILRSVWQPNYLEQMNHLREQQRAGSIIQ